MVGVTRCSSFGLETDTCNPLDIIDETECNGVDDDCDGTVDEEFLSEVGSFPPVCTGHCGGLIGVWGSIKGKKRGGSVTDRKKRVKIDFGVRVEGGVPISFGIRQ